jgi:hypothetical protein
VPQWDKASNNPSLDQELMDFPVADGAYDITIAIDVESIHLLAHHDMAATDWHDDAAIGHELPMEIQSAFSSPPYVL